MREVTLEELKEIAENSRAALWGMANSCNRDVKIYLHWTAARYNQLFNDYHISIVGDGDIYISTEDFSEVKPHTYARNTGSVGITLCCGYNASTDELGDYPPTAEQIEIMAKVIAVVADALWLTIDKDHIMTHGEAANNEDGIYPHEAYAVWNDEEGDGNTRWDLEYLGTPESPSYNPWATDGSRGGDVLRGKALWYRNKWEQESK